MEEKKYIKHPCEKPNVDQMIGYKAPIDVLMGAVRDDFDGRIFSAVQMVDIEVDRDELIKALQYDRGQYEKGYNDGGKVAAKEILTEILECIITNQYVVDANRNTYVPAKSLYDDVCDLSKKWGVPLIECEEGKSVVFGKFKEKENDT